jgi:hypothetical protein
MLRALAFAAILIVPTLAPAQSVVCAGKIINAGISQAEVSAKCGAPAQVDHSTKYLGAAIADPAQPSYIAGATDEVQVEV